MVITAKIRTTSSYRSLSKVICIVNMYLNIECHAPSFSTAMLWVKKIGYYQLQSPKEKADDWIIIVDESIGIGQEKVLVVLGIRQSKFDFTRPLKIQDMEPITVKSREKWSWQDIANELEIVKAKLGTVKYAVTDAGCSLKKGLKESGITRIHDITHSIATFLEKIYRNDNEFKAFTHQAGQMRYMLCCSKHAHLIPPNQRSKSRFLNIDIISKWGMVALSALDKDSLSLQDREQLQWVKENQSLIMEMNNLISVIENISILLKNEGLSKHTKGKCLALLKGFKQGKLKQFREYMTAYLKENAQQINRKTKKLICCSDIIESTFGKYKNELSKNAMSGITDLVLIIPAFTSNLTIESVNEAIDSCTVKTIENWKKENLCNSLIAKRKRVFCN